MINDLKDKIEKMKQKHIQALRLAAESPIITKSDRKM